MQSELFWRRNTGASLAIFANPANFKKTPVERPDYSKNIQGQWWKQHTTFFSDELYQQQVIDHLNHRASNLMKIIEKKGEP